MNRKYVLKQIVKEATLPSTEVFPIPSPPVCVLHEKSLNLLPFSQAGVIFSQDFLDSIPHIRYSYIMNHDVSVQAARVMWRAFSFSKSRARWFVGQSVWRRWSGASSNKGLLRTQADVSN